MAPFKAKHAGRLAGLTAALVLAGCTAYGPGGYYVYGSYGGYGTPYASDYYGEPYAYAPYAGGYEEPFGLGVFGFGVGGGGHDHDWDHHDWDHHDWDHGHAWNHWQHHGVFVERNGMAQAGGFAHPGPRFGGTNPRIAAAVPHAPPPPPGHRI